MQKSCSQPFRRDSLIQNGFPNTSALRAVCRVSVPSSVIQDGGPGAVCRYAAAAAAAKLLQSCLTLCDLIDGSPQGSPIPGILQARILKWVAISFSNA